MILIKQQCPPGISVYLAREHKKMATMVAHKMMAELEVCGWSEVLFYMFKKKNSAQIQ